jgi:hypothetical protein
VVNDDTGCMRPQWALPCRTPQLATHRHAQIPDSSAPCGPDIATRSTKMSREGTHGLEHGHVTRQFEDVDRELARLAYLCDVDLSNEDNVRGVIADNLPSAPRAIPGVQAHARPAHVALRAARARRGVDRSGRDTGHPRGRHRAHSRPLPAIGAPGRLTPTSFNILSRRHTQLRARSPRNRAVRVEACSPTPCPFGRAAASGESQQSRAPNRNHQTQHPSSDIPSGVYPNCERMPHRARREDGDAPTDSNIAPRLA